MKNLRNLILLLSCFLCINVFLSSCGEDDEPQDEKANPYAISTEVKSVKFGDGFIYSIVIYSDAKYRYSINVSSTEVYMTAEVNVDGEWKPTGRYTPAYYNFKAIPRGKSQSLSEITEKVEIKEWKQQWIKANAPSSDWAYIGGFLTKSGKKKYFRMIQTDCEVVCISPGKYKAVWWLFEYQLY